ncbi:MAG: hypothetical protein H6604_09725 [Flavobacteriales bacterium]|nr:hypothetical protein [Flavobacteriales bacterium]
MKKTLTYIFLVVVFTQLDAQVKSSKIFTEETKVVLEEIKTQNDILKKLMLNYFNKTSNCNLSPNQLSTLKNSNEKLKRSIPEIIKNIKKTQESAPKKNTNTNSNNQRLDNIIVSLKKYFGPLTNKMEFSKQENSISIIIDEKELFYKSELTYFGKQFSEKLSNYTFILKRCNLTIETEDSYSKKRNQSIEQIKLLEKEIIAKHPTIKNRISLQQDTPFNSLFNPKTNTKENTYQFIIYP